MGFITIATLNVKGANSSATHDKWKAIIHTMLAKRLTILCVLKSHSDNPQIERLNSQFGPNLNFIHTHDRDHAHSGGIIIVTNLNKIQRPPSNIVEIKAGRAISYTINWPENTQTNILTMYAPNPPHENAALWNQITNYTRENPATTPNIVLGDFNMVEDPKDRLPQHPDAMSNVEALQELKSEIRITDGWRKANPQNVITPSNSPWVEANHK